MASAIDFVSGCVGGAAGVLIGHPFDTIKVIMQTSQQRRTAMSVVRDCSISSLYQGIKAPLSGLAAINAIVFGVHGSIMRFCPRESPKENLVWNAVAGSLAGLAQSIICSPIELLKTRAQLSSQTVWHCTKQVIKSEGGFRGLYRGFGITMARDCPAFATYFCTYELILQKLKLSKHSLPSTMDVLMAGGTAGALSWFVIYPLDVLKSRIQASVKYSTVRECLQDTVHREGLAVLMRGCSPTLVRAFPANAATFAMVTWTLYTYDLYINTKRIIQF